MEFYREFLHTMPMAGDPVLGGALRAARTRLKLSQAAVAKAVGDLTGTSITGAAVGQWELGDARPKTENLIAACSFLGIDLAKATEGKDVPVVSDPATISHNEFTHAEEPLPSRRTMPQDVPVFGTGVGGVDGEFYMNGEVVDRVRRPPGLLNTKRAYAVYVSGHSMEPRFENGELVYVNPDRPPSIGDYVLIELGPTEDQRNGPGYIKRLVRRTAEKLICEQLNPKKSVTFPAKRVAKLHRIMRWNEVLGI